MSDENIPWNARCGGPYGRIHFEAQKTEIRQKREEIISKLENGAERYQSDAFTYHIIESLARGTDPISAIDYLLKSHAEMSKRMIELLTNNAPPLRIEVDKEQADNFLKTIKK